MRKGTILVVAGCLLAAVAYQLLTADANGTSRGYAVEIAARNATYTAFAEARRLVEQAGPSAAFAPPGRRLVGAYGEASYRTHVVTRGTSIYIHSMASVAHGRDTVGFAVSAEVAWTARSGDAVADTTASYLILKSYREGIRPVPRVSAASPGRPRGPGALSG